jgi:hypothetical protein
MISVEEVDGLRASGVRSWVENLCACIEIFGDISHKQQVI